MLEFFITTVRDGFELAVNGTRIDVFATREAAADLAVRFAQDNQAACYRIFF